MTFADLHLSDDLLRAVSDSGYDTPTAIQAAAIPAVLMGRDLIGVAQTGTGKTASFVLPMIDILAQGRARARMPRSLILEPTRELAAQVAENFEKYGKYHKLNMALLIGGVSFGDQDRALEKGVDVLIATPGRLMDQHARGKILLSGVDVLVIDEADRMLDMGFIPDVEKICALLKPQRQTLLFSATMAPPIRKLADRFMTNPKQVEVARAASTNADIEQRLMVVDGRGKRVALERVLGAAEVKNAIVFSNRKTTVRELATALKRAGFKAGQIQGDLEQADRIRELDRFKAGEITILVASDVAARGLDIKGVSHVVNFDVPWHPDDYVHRIGRTGRAGATGIAITLATGADEEAVSAIEKLIGQKIPRVGGAGPAEPSAEAPRAAERPRRERRPRVAADEAAAPAEAGDGARKRTRSRAKPVAPVETDAPDLVALDAPRENTAVDEDPVLAAGEAPRRDGRSRRPRREPGDAPRERAPRQDEPRRADTGRDAPRGERRPGRAQEAREDREDAGMVGFGGDVPAFLQVSARR